MALKNLISMKFSLVLAVLIFGAAALNSVHAQESSTDSFESLQYQFKKEYLSVGALLQTVGEYQYKRIAGTGNNGFSVGNARFQLYGEIDNSFGYQLQANFI